MMGQPRRPPSTYFGSMSFGWNSLTVSRATSPNGSIQREHRAGGSGATATGALTTGSGFEALQAARKSVAVTRLAAINLTLGIFVPLTINHRIHVPSCRIERRMSKPRQPQLCSQPALGAVGEAQRSAIGGGEIGHDREAKSRAGLGFVQALAALRRRRA